MVKIVKVFGWLVALLLVVVVVLLVFITVNEYKPEPVAPAGLEGEASKQLILGETLRLVTFNVGYCSLDENQDFFMDGGKNVHPASDENVKGNVAGIQEWIAAGGYDVVMMQEVDMNSRRSYGVDQAAAFSADFPGMSQRTINFKATYVPYPFLKNIGKVESGLLTLSRFEGEKGQRIALPTSYKWPIRTCQLKRCLMTQEIPIVGNDGTDTGKKLILVNLHLEAYSTGDAKEKQTEVLLRFIKGEYEKGNYVIAGGDFNQTMPGVDPSLYPIIDAEHFMAEPLSADILPEDWRFAYDETVPTSRLLSAPLTEEQKSGDLHSVQRYVIDGYILSPNVELKSVKTVDQRFRYSDHNPVELSIMLK